MHKDELLKHAKDPKYIPGIYNYCDRWCERCQFTSRCLNCTLVEEQFGDLQTLDELNEEFWEKLSDMLQNTIALVKEMAKEQGIDLEEICTDKKMPTVIINTPNIVTHLSRKYAKSVDDWFNSNEHAFYEKRNKLNSVASFSNL